MDFNQNLMDMTADTLRNLLREVKGKGVAGTKEVMAERLQTIWQAEPQRIVGLLSEPELKLLAECVHEGQAFPDVERVNARYGFAYSIPYRGGSRKAYFIHCFICKPDRYSDYELVDGVKERLAKQIPAPPPLTVKQSVFPDREDSSLKQYNSERIALAEAKRVLQLVAAGKLKVGEKTRLPSAACIKQVDATLCEPETPFSPKRSRAWPVLIQQCGWAKPRAGKLFLTKIGKALLENFTAKGYATGVREMIHDTVFDEMFRASEIKGLKGKWARRSIVKANLRRLSISTALEDFPVGKWIGFADAFNYAIASGNPCHVVENGSCLYICDTTYGGLGGYELEIAKVYFRVLAVESFATLGLLDIASPDSAQWGSPDIPDCWGMDGVESLTDYDSVDYLRLTPLGAFCLGTATDYEIQKAEKRTLFNVLPNHEIVVTDAAAFSAGDAALLERFAKKVSDAVWKMNKKTVFHALETGDSADDIWSVLQAGTANEIPKPVRLLIEEVVARSGAVTQREAAEAITFRDEHTAALAEHEPAIRPAVFCRQGATLFVRAKNLKKVQSGLRKLGILLP